MKKALAILLALVICLGCAGCGKDSGSAVEALTLPKNMQMYAPGVSVSTSFGSITIMDAAFCQKAQLYFTKASSSMKTTINGQVAESYTEFINPGYLSTMDNKLIFALRTVITNTTNQDLTLKDIPVKAFFSEKDPVFFSTGGNYEISDPAYGVLSAGESGEYILAALLPLEFYQRASACRIEIDSSELGFPYDSIHVYNALGFQEADNAPISTDLLLQSLGGGVSETTPETASGPVEVQYYREAKDLPTVDSVTGLELSQSAYDSSNGTITRMRYYYQAPTGAKNGPEMIEEYLAYLRDNGFTVQEDGINADVSRNGTTLAAIQITGTSMMVGIDLVQKDANREPIQEVKTVSPGDTITLDFVEIKIDDIHHGAEIKEDDGPNTYHRRPSNNSNQMFWLETTMKNTGTSTFNIWGIKKYFAEIVFDGKYSYEASIDKLVGMGNTELKPFESAKVYIWAEIPAEMLNQYQHVSIRFAFNDYFERADEKDFDSMQNRFEFHK